MKNLRIAAVLMFAFLAFSCSSSEDEEGSSNVLLNTPVAGTIYGTPFTVNSSGGYASNILNNGIEKVNIHLTSQNVGCAGAGSVAFPVNLLVPRAIGTHTANLSATFKDPDSTDFITISNFTVEIISVGATVKGRVMAKSVAEDVIINGKFEVPYCL